MKKKILTDICYYIFSSLGKKFNCNKMREEEEMIDFLL